MSASSSAKSNSAMFSRIRDGVVDFGITTLPSWRCQRSTTCAGVRPCRSRELGDRRIAAARWPCPSGLHASVTMPCSAWKRAQRRLLEPGCSSTWLTAGTTAVSSSSRCRWAIWKFDTPIARARPSA